MRALVLLLSVLVLITQGLYFPSISYYYILLLNRLFNVSMRSVMNCVIGDVFYNCNCVRKLEMQTKTIGNQMKSNEQ